MPAVHPLKKERKDATLGISKEIKARLIDLDFVKKHSYNKILEVLMDSYEEHKKCKKKK